MVSAINPSAKETVAFNEKERITDKSALGRIMDKKLDDQFDVFMKMFLAQVKHQDPTKPMSTNEMTANVLSFFSAAEQAKGNHLLSQMNESKVRDQFTAAKTYLNKDVVFETDSFVYNGGSEDFDIQIPKNLKDVQLLVLNENQQVVTSYDLAPQVPHQRITWYGDLDSGQPVQPGRYFIYAFGKDPLNNTVSIPVQMHGTVSEVEYTDDNDFRFIVNGSQVPMEKVVSVRKNSASPLLGTVQEIQQQLKSYEELLKDLKEPQVMAPLKETGDVSIDLVDQLI